MQHKTAVYPGRFDPTTRGHLDLILRANRLFGQVVVAVSEDAGKSSFWSLEKRLQAMRMVCASHASITVLPFSGLLVDWVKAQGADCIVRGIRDSVDMSVEWRMAHSNRVLNQDIETIFLASSPEVSHISGTLVRQVMASGGDVAAFVPETILAFFGASQS